MTQNAKSLEKYINPRVILGQKGGRDILFELISKSGYVPQKAPFLALCNAIFRCTPLLLEGPRGCGKTTLPEALAAALNLMLFMLPCLDDTSTESILFSWDRDGQHYFVEDEMRKGTELQNERPKRRGSKRREIAGRDFKLKEALENKWSSDFVKKGEVLSAYDYSARNARPSILLVDEIDKLQTTAESAFLQILTSGHATVPNLRPDPRIGYTPDYPSDLRYESYPIVILTSNNMGSGVSAPLRSRCRYCFFPLPTVYETISVIAARVPEATTRLLYQTSKLINGINGLPLLDKPALREFIELMATFHAYGNTYITVDMIADNIDCLAKNETDYRSLLDAVDLLFKRYVEQDDKKLHEMVGDIVVKRQNLLNK